MFGKHGILRVCKRSRAQVLGKPRTLSSFLSLDWVDLGQACPAPHLGCSECAFPRMAGWRVSGRQAAVVCIRRDCFQREWPGRETQSSPAACAAVRDRSRPKLLGLTSCLLPPASGRGSVRCAAVPARAPSGQHGPGCGHPSTVYPSRSLLPQVTGHS